MSNSLATTDPASQTLRGVLSDLLLSLPGTATVRDRQALVHSAGILGQDTQIEWEGPALQFFDGLLTLQETQGQAALLSFVEALANAPQVDTERRQQLTDLVHRMAGLDDAAFWTAFLGPIPPCPYPGMTPFREVDSDNFFGRSREIAEGAQLLRLHPFLTVIGSSGSGKSSLVFAGILPVLRKSSHLGQANLLVRSLRPGATPMAALAQELGCQSATVAGLADCTRSLAAATPLLLIVDQFEETFTSADKSQVASFQETLVRLTTLPNVYLILTVRADFYPDLMNSPLWEEIKDHRLEVTALRGDGLRDAVVKPAARVGVTVEPVLVERLLADAAGEPGVLPFVQETLVLLWDTAERRRLTLADYAALTDRDGRTGLSVAMARRADQTLKGLSPAGQTVARRTFLRLVQFGEGRPDTRRQQTEADLRTASDAPERFAEVLRQLVDHRLLTTDSGESSPERKVDIAHEALLSGWPTLRKWTSERRDAEQQRRRLEVKATEWIRLGSGDGGLLDQTELPEAERWLTSTDAAELGFSAALRDLVDQSRRFLDDQTRAETEARERELQQARALAAKQKQASQRTLLAVLVGAVAVTAAIVAVWFFVASGREASLRGEAEAKATEAADARATAEAAAERAGVAEATARAAQQEAEVKATEAAVAQTAAEVAADSEAEQRQRAERQERLALANQLAAAAQIQALSQPTLTVLLATEALSIPWSQDGARPAAAEAALRQGLQLLAAEPLTVESGVRNATTLTHDEVGQGLTLAAFDPGPVLWRGKSLSSPAGALSETLPGEAPQPGTWSQVWSLARLSPDARQLAFVSPNISVDQGMEVWKTDTLAEPWLRIPISGTVQQLEFSSNGRWLAAADVVGKIGVWDLIAADLQPVATRVSSLDPTALAISGDGRRLAVASSSDFVRLFDLEAESEPLILLGHRGAISALAFSPDQAALASASVDGSARLWDVASGTLLRFQEGLPGIRAVTFSPDGDRLVLGGADGSVHIWSVADPNAGPLTLLAANRQDESEDAAIGPAITAVAFSPDGRWVSAVDTGGMIYSWHDNAEELILAACAAVDRNLTVPEWRTYLGTLPYAKTCPEIVADLPAGPLQNRQVIDAFLAAGRELNENGWLLLDRGGQTGALFAPEQTYSGPAPEAMQALTLAEQEVVSRMLHQSRQNGTEVAELRLWQNSDLLEIPLGPPPEYQIQAPGEMGPLPAKVAATWNRYGRAAAAAAHLTGLSPDVAVAVLFAETLASTQEAVNDTVIRFENHFFYEFWGKDHPEEFAKYFAFDPGTGWLDHKWRPSPDQPWQTFHGRQEAEWRVLNFARALDERAALRSISMGGPQIMGFQFDQLGYGDPVDMFAVLSNQEIGRYADVFVLFDFLSPQMLESLRWEDFLAFATEFNGPGIADYYATMIAQVVGVLRDLATFELGDTAANSEADADTASDTPHSRAAEHQAALLEETRRLALAGEIDRASESLLLAITVNPDRLVPAADFDLVCWNGSLNGQAADVINLCETAVGREPENMLFHESLAAAYGLTGAYERASRHLSYVAFWAKMHRPVSEFLAERQAWLAALNGGANPFNDSVLLLMDGERAEYAE